MKIMILEDEFTSLQVIKELMSAYGEVDTSETGIEALELFSNSLANNQKYDLVCLDIMVPEINGQEVLKLIREMEEAHGSDTLSKRSKVIMISALNDQDNLMAAFREGKAEGYIFKPYSKEKVEETLSKLNLI